MASASCTISTFSICERTSSFRRHGHGRFQLQAFRFQNQCSPILTSFSSASNGSLSFTKRFPRSLNFTSSAASNGSLSFTKRFPRSLNFTSSVTAEDEAQVDTAPQQENEASSTASPTDQTVSVSVSPSDVLTMFFQAEGTMSEAAIPTVSQALEETEGIADLRVQVLEGIASVELTKQTTVQATGVASNLVEIIQSKGFKLQTLNLSFQDEEDLN